MIARTWRGATRAEDADTYVEYLHRTGLAAYAATEGNRGVLCLRDVRGDRAEFLLVSLWEDMAAVRRFAGNDPTRAVFYPDVDHLLVDRDETVHHYEVVYRSEP